MFNFEAANPPKNAEMNNETYPIGSMSERGSGRERAMAVEIRSRAILIPIVIARAKREEFISLSSVL